MARCDIAARLVVARHCVLVAMLFAALGLDDIAGVVVVVVVVLVVVFVVDCFVVDCFVVAFEAMLLFACLQHD